MERFLAAPTWLLNKALDNKFSGYSLQRWHAGQTSLCKQFDAVFWICGLSILTILATKIAQG